MASDDRLQVALAHFGRAQARLAEVLLLPEDNFIRDALIQRFKFTFEAGWKAAYRWLRARGVDVDEDAFSVIPRPSNAGCSLMRPVGAGCARTEI